MNFLFFQEVGGNQILLTPSYLRPIGFSVQVSEREDDGTLVASTSSCIIACHTRETSSCRRHLICWSGSEVRGSGALNSTETWTWT
ncbi:unnamed protein product [Pleuronectes platessa]|uniref:Uncharacterized protein n=1 Tax=Pleuronectes platessa TaxID=8262 RepID=A0A9N7YGD3_PLEPL|nr:unnamed protein product [Pleuronectes platessa]